MRMLTSRLLATCGAVLLAAGALSACTPAPAAPTRTPTVAHTPVFASDADALKAATDAYAAYLAMSDTIAHEGGKDPDRIKPFVTEAWYSKEIDAFKTFSSHSLVQTGWTEYRSQRLQSNRSWPIKIVMYVCVDPTKTAIVDASGNIVTPPDRPDVVPFVATFVGAGTSQSNQLRLEDYEAWPGQSFC